MPRAVSAIQIGDPEKDASENAFHNWRELSAAAFLAFLIPASAGIFAKYSFLSTKGFDAIAAALSARSLTIGQKLSFFRGDLAFGIFVAPAAILMVRFLLPFVWCRRVVRFAALVAVFIQFLAWGQLSFLGNLPGRALLMEGLNWSVYHTAAAVNLLAPFLFSPKRIVLAISAAAASVAALVFARTPLQRHSEFVLHHVRAAAEPLWVLGAVLTIVSWLPWMRTTLYHSPTIWLAVESLWDSGPVGHVQYEHFEASSIPRKYRALANAPDPEASGRYWAMARGYNVVLFVMETGPARFLPWLDHPGDFPSVARLARQAWVSQHHYTTSPISYKADTSILTSLYPPTYNRNFEDKPSHMPGLIRVLSSAGYRTNIYLPYSPGPRWVKQETHFFQTLGPDQVFIPDIPPVMLGDQGSWRDADRLDEAALQELEQDFTASVSGRQRFFAIYLPQLSHDPWVDTAAGGREASMQKRRYNLMKREDQRLGELLSSIERAGQLDRTLILVTCDHGLRTSAGDAVLPVGRIDELTFNVPFLLYAPGILRESTPLPWITSHIDIAPSILALLGLRGDPGFEAGAPIWNEALRRRSVFFWGLPYYGADGYVQGNLFAMWNANVNMVLLNQRLHFDGTSPAAPEGREQAEIMGLLQRVGDLKDDWYTAASAAPAK